MAKITLINKTDETVRLALFMMPVQDPTLDSIAWRIAAPPPGGSTTIEVPDDFAVQVRYSSDPSNPSHLDTTLAPLAFAEYTASFSIDATPAGDGHAAGAAIRQVFTDLILNEVRIANHYPLGVEVALLKGGDPIFPPRVLWPGALLMQDIRGAIHVAVVSQAHMAGGRIVQEEIGQAMVDLPLGGTLVVSGSQWTGYALTVQ